jgi:hypothetical protein
MKNLIFKTALLLIFASTATKLQSQIYVDVKINNHNSTLTCSTPPSFLITTTPGSVWGPYTPPTYTLPYSTLSFTCVNMGVPTSINVYDGTCNFTFNPNTSGRISCTPATGFCSGSTCVCTVQVESTLTGPLSPSTCNPPFGTRYELVIDIW